TAPIEAPAQRCGCRASPLAGDARRSMEHFDESAATRDEALRCRGAVRPPATRSPNRTPGDLGGESAVVRESPACLAEQKKKILRTLHEEIIVSHDEASDTLSCVLHWAGGAHTAPTTPKPRSGVGQPTGLEDLELIQRIAARYGGTRSQACSTSWGCGP